MDFLSSSWYFFLFQLKTMTKIRYGPDCGRPDKDYKTKKSILDRPSGPMAQQIEVLSLYGSRWALSKAVSNPTQAGQRFTWLKTWCDRQQLWKAVITGDTVTRHIIPIRGHGKSPEEGQRWNFGRNVVKEETTQKLPRWWQKVRNK